MTFGVVAFTIIVQGLAIKPLLQVLREDAYELARAQQISVSSARSELDNLRHNQLLSDPAYDQLRQELDAELVRLASRKSGRNWFWP